MTDTQNIIESIQRKIETIEADIHKLHQEMSPADAPFVLGKKKVEDTGRQMSELYQTLTKTIENDTRKYGKLRGLITVLGWIPLSPYSERNRQFSKLNRQLRQAKALYEQAMDENDTLIRQNGGYRSASARKNAEAIKTLRQQATNLSYALAAIPVLNPDNITTLEEAEAYGARGDVRKSIRGTFRSHLHDDRAPVTDSDLTAIASMASSVVLTNSFDSSSSDGGTSFGAGF